MGGKNKIRNSGNNLDVSIKFLGLLVFSILQA